ncbi:MAG: A/G-specific adenine glycosylase [Flavobacteriia bacterium]|nr:A/G-specific adenine glycosylase [Flavobacteriia bacterium]
MTLSSELRSWYRIAGRDLPWRRTRSPYAIWLSEIILQQTRVAQGLPYYEQFLNNFPTVESLANASEDEVLKMWEGLGYYSRARNLHKGAKFIAENGFPNSFEAWLNVPGVGHYTAAAVASFVHDEEVAVVDGNVQRVLARVYNIDTPVNSSEGIKVIREVAQEIIKDEPPAEHNQAMMELGALVCTPKNPDCVNCPINSRCQSLQDKVVSDRPIKLKKKKPTAENLYYTALYSSEGLLIRKRGTDSIWKGLYELIPSHPEDIDELKTDSQTFPSHKITHLLSHKKLEITIYSVEVNGPFKPKNTDAEWKKWSEIQQLAFPRPIRRWLDENLLPLHLGSHN